MTFSMNNTFITISNDDRDVLQQERNTNLANTHKLEKHSPVPVSCRKVIRGTDLSKHSTTQKYIEMLHRYIPILARYTTV